MLNQSKHIFFNENVWIWIEISLKFVTKGPINNIPSLVQIMAWRRPGDKPLSEPMMVSIPTHICVTRPQWVNVYLTNLQYFAFFWWTFIQLIIDHWPWYNATWLFCFHIISGEICSCILSSKVGLRENHHASVVWNWYHWVAIAYLYQPSP